MLDAIKRQFREINKHRLLLVIFFKIRSIYSICDDFIRKILGKKPVQYFINVLISDHCNLNCKGCSVCSNLVQTEAFASLEQFKKDISRLSELFSNLRRIDILGGEPLLNKELPQFIQAARNAFPKSKINLITNGLLYKAMSDELIDSIKHCNVVVRITLYKPLVPHKDELAKYLSHLGISKVSISKPIMQFAKFLNPKGDSDAKKIFEQCPSRRCNILNDGCIFVCRLPVVAQRFDQYFNTAISTSSNDYLIDIYDPKMDGFLIKKKLSKPISFCKYCTYPEWFDWEQSASNARIEDFCSGMTK